MIYFWVFFISTFFLSCTHSINSKKIHDRENYSGCYYLPLKNEDLGYQSVHAFGNPVKGLVFTGKKRSMVNTYYYTPLNNGQIERKSLNSLNWSENSVIYGGGIIRDKLVSALYSPSKVGKSKIELRDLNSNVVLAFSRPESTSRRLGNVAFDNNNGFWIIEQKDVDDEYSHYDKPFNLSYIKFISNDSLKRIPIRNLSIYGSPKIIPGSLGKNALVIWMEEKKRNSGNKYLFKYLEVYSNGTKSPIRQLSYIPIDGVESFKLIKTRNSIFLATVEGDSLLGEAKVKISKILWNSSYLNISWTKEIDLEGDHVSDPIFTANGNAVYLFLPKWVDEMVSISRYDVGEENILQKGTFGRYSEGTAVSSIFYNQFTRKFSMILRKKQKNFGLRSFLMCDVHL